MKGIGCVASPFMPTVAFFMPIASSSLKKSDYSARHHHHPDYDPDGDFCAVLISLQTRENVSTQPPRGSQ
jgi:hypothetical protein